MSHFLANKLPKIENAKLTLGIKATRQLPNKNGWGKKESKTNAKQLVRNQSNEKPIYHEILSLLTGEVYSTDYFHNKKKFETIPTSTPKCY